MCDSRWMNSSRGIRFFCQLLRCSDTSVLGSASLRRCASRYRPRPVVMAPSSSRVSRWGRVSIGKRGMACTWRWAYASATGRRIARARVRPIRSRLMSMAPRLK
ncbi:hypothetical protein D3C85_1193900 [compost metagenome]